MKVRESANQQQRPTGELEDEVVHGSMMETRSNY